MMDLGLIPILELDPKTYEVCVQFKYSKKNLIKSVERCSKLLWLMHNTIYELKDNLTRFV